MPNYNKRYKDETGKKHGFLMPLRYTRTDPYKGAMFECKCRCGNIVEVSGCELRSGNRVSCGCAWSTHKKPKPPFCSVCGSEKVYCKGMCYNCYRKQWEEKRREEMERFL